MYFPDSVQLLTSVLRYSFLDFIFKSASWRLSLCHHSLVSVTDLSEIVLKSPEPVMFSSFYAESVCNLRSLFRESTYLPGL